MLDGRSWTSLSFWGCRDRSWIFVWHKVFHKNCTHALTRWIAIFCDIKTSLTQTCDSYQVIVTSSSPGDITHFLDKSQSHLSESSGLISPDNGFTGKIRSRINLRTDFLMVVIMDSYWSPPTKFFSRSGSINQTSCKARLLPDNFPHFIKTFLAFDLILFLSRCCTTCEFKLNFSWPSRPVSPSLTFWINAFKVFQTPDTPKWFEGRRDITKYNNNLEQREKIP